MTGRYPDWAIEGADWPNRKASSFVRAGGYEWHVQQMGKGKVCLLIHGTGAATHSWRDVMPLLAQSYHVVAMDLPGHGFTKTVSSGRVSLPGMATSIEALLDHLKITPDLIVGHSAGVAIAAQLMLDSKRPRGHEGTLLVGFTPALMPFPGLAAKIFPQLAKLLFTNPFVAIIFSRMAKAPGQTEKFLSRSTGSKIDATCARYYQRLFSKSGHCDGAIRMMANWQLEKLGARLGTLASPILLVRAAKDAAIPKAAVLQAAALIPGCNIQEMAALGHLAHEEDPVQAVQIIEEFAKMNWTR